MSLKTPQFFLAGMFLCVSMATVAQNTTPEAGLTTNPVFQKECAKCHGKNAEGRHFGGPSLSSPTVSGASKDELGVIISNGKGRMPKYAGKLSSQEITTLVEQIEAMNKK